MCGGSPPSPYAFTVRWLIKQRGIIPVLTYKMTMRDIREELKNRNHWLPSTSSPRTQMALSFAGFPGRSKEMAQRDLWTETQYQHWQAAAYISKPTT
jgi:hypothetical protein